jgi:glycosyltransferase involved in cell wall biosynthesis
MSWPLISVILCVRDGGSYLSQALDSVGVQEIESKEVIVVDDGSTDHSAKIAVEHAVAPKVIRQKPLGLAAGLNRACCEARGRFLSFLDADDVWPADRLSIMIAPFDRSPDVDLVYGALVNTNPQLQPIGPVLTARLLNTALIRRVSALKVGEIRTDVQHGANVDWISRALAIGLQFVAVDSVVLFRRIHGGNSGLRDRDKARRDMIRVIRDHHARKTQK